LILGLLLLLRFLECGFGFQDVVWFGLVWLFENEMDFQIDILKVNSLTSY